MGLVAVTGLSVPSPPSEGALAGGPRLGLLWVLLFETAY